MDDNIAQLSFALSIANASADSRGVLCFQALGVASAAVSLAEEALWPQWVTAQAPSPHHFRFSLTQSLHTASSDLPSRMLTPSHLVTLLVGWLRSTVSPHE